MMRRSFSIAMICAVLALCVAAAAPQDSARRTMGAAALAGAGAADRLVVSGSNDGVEAQILVIRIDDSYRPSYAERINVERVIPPGPFRLSLTLGGLTKPSGEALRLNRLRQVIAFAAGNGLRIDSVERLAGQALPAGVLGWDLGPAGSALWPGMTPLEPGFAGLSGRQLRAVERGSRQQANEGLTTDGIRGIESLALPLERGTWHVTLWLGDRGEWEYLPHPLQRLVKANGKPVLDVHTTSREWIRERYLRGIDTEYRPQDDTWTRYGEQADERVSFSVEVADQGLVIAFSGHMPEAGFVAAVVAERQPGFAGRDQVERQRAQWWRQNWPVDHPQASEVAAPRLESTRDRVTVARGTTGTLTLTLRTPRGDSRPEVSLSALGPDARRLHTTLRWGRWQLRRSTLSSTLLQPVDRHLRAASTLPADNGLPRRLHVEVDVPDDMPAGSHRLLLTVDWQGTRLEYPLTVDVPDVDLPAADRPIGVYLERPVQFDWFDDLAGSAQSALACDLRYLRGIGLTGISPGFTTPDGASATQRLLEELAQVERAGFVAPYLAYAPFKRLQQKHGTEAAVLALKAVDERIAASTLPVLAWSIADEPSNPGQQGQLEMAARYADSFAPDTLLAGHLNDVADRHRVGHLDIALINHGFGVDSDDVDDVRNSGTAPWFYNMEAPRAAAGFYLWQTGAQGYLQWHARMPTAAPFDPTDGREDDVQLLYPAAEPCPAAHDVSSELFVLVEGINDLRWLLWLERAAGTNPAAARYLEAMRKTIPKTWEAMKQVDAQVLDRWRAGIVAIATRGD